MRTGYILFKVIHAKSSRTRSSFKFLDLLWLTMKDFLGKISLFSGSEYRSLRFFLMTALTLGNRGSHFMITGIRSVHLLADFLSAFFLLILLTEGNSWSMCLPSYLRFRKQVLYSSSLLSRRLLSEQILNKV